MKPIHVIGSVVAMLVGVTNLWAMPAQILVIRHGEKPKKGNDLSTAGEARAQALVGLFEDQARFTTYGTPVAIYAMLPSSNDESIREIETVTPLANSLGLKINETYTRKQYPQMAEEILKDPAYDGKMVLICWDHTVIPQLVSSLGAPKMAKWPKNVFDRVIEINYSSDGTVTSFDNLPQDLMPGDSPD